MHAPYSYTKLALYEKCPQAWKFHYIDKIPEKDSASLIVGRMVHEAVAEYINSLIKSQNQTNLSILDQIIDKYRANAGAYSSEFEEYVEGMRQIILPPVSEAAVEAKVAVNRSWRPVEYNKAFLRGRIDFLYHNGGTVVITDWKTNRYIPPQSKILEDRQLKVYALLTSVLTPTDNFVVQLSYLRYGGGHHRIVELELEDLEETKDWVLRTVDKIESEEEWKPTPGAHCNWCSYIDRCPAAASAITEDGPDTIRTPEEAIEAAQQYKLLGVKKARLEAKLKEWVDQNGPIQVAGEVLDYHLSTTVKWETRDQKMNLARVMVEAGIPKEEIWDVFSASKRAVQSFLKGKKELLKKALATGQEEASVRFAFKKE